MVSINLGIIIIGSAQMTKPPDGIVRKSPKSNVKGAPNECKPRR